MGKLIFRWFLSRTVRRAVDMCRQVRRLVRAQSDLIGPASIEEIARAANELKLALRTNEGLDEVRRRMDRVEAVANKRLQPYPSASIRENIEVFLVTGAVVLALRTFFFQPMAIPSGSAQPTLWGIHAEDMKGKPDAAIPGRVRRFVDFWVSGVRYYHLVAKNDGELYVEPQPRTVFPFVKRQTLRIGGQPHPLWFIPEDISKLTRLDNGRHYRKGEEILKLKVVSGDHLFVNCMIYNFRRPRRGEIIVFHSTGVPQLIQDTHYIKRLVALGGDRVRINNRHHLVINGQVLDASTPHFENVYGFDPNQPPRPDRYSGHINNSVARQIGLSSRTAELFPDESAEVSVRKRHYLAFGDNTMNSFDGRAWGDFPQEKVVGRSAFVFWPISERFGWGYR